MVMVAAGVVCVALAVSASALAAAKPKFVESFAAKAGGSVQRLAVNEETGELFVLDPLEDSIDRYSSSGAPLGQIKGSETQAKSFGLSQEESDDVAVDNSGGPTRGYVYVSSQSGPKAVYAFKPENGGYKEIWERESAPGAEFTLGVTVDPAGHPWVSSGFNEEVIELEAETGNAAGLAINTSGLIPFQLAFDAEGNLYVNDQQINERIAEYTKTGEFVREVTTGQHRDIAVDLDSRRASRVYAMHGIWVGYGIETWDSAGRPATSFDTPAGGEGIMGIAIDSKAGKIYVTNSAENTIELWAVPAFYELAIEKTGGGSGMVTASNPSGTIECGSTCSSEFEEETEVVLTEVADSGSTFTGWTGCEFEPSPSECQVSLDKTTTVRAHFAEAFTLTINKTGSGSVTSTPAGIDCGATCSGSFLEGTSVTLTANPLAHNKVSWEGCAAQPAADKCEVTLDSSKTVSATFAPIMHTLTIAKAGGGSGNVTCNGEACSASYPEGTTITVAATAASGSSFGGFSGGGCSGATCSITLEADTTVTATFDAVVSGGGTPAPTPSPIPTPAPSPKPKPASKVLKCKRGFVKKKSHGKTRCVKAKKHHKKRKRHGKKYTKKH